MSDSNFDASAFGRFFSSESGISMANTPPRERWHVGKEIPIALIFALFTQTCGWIWWAATQSAKLDNLTSMMSDFKAGQYTQSDARRDMEVVLSREKDMTRRIEILEQENEPRR